MASLHLLPHHLHLLHHHHRRRHLHLHHRHHGVLCSPSSPPFACSIGCTSPWASSSAAAAPLPSSSSSSSSGASAPSLPPKKVLVPIGMGTEEIEAVVMVDILRRAGADVVLASVEKDLQVEASRRVNLVADLHISSCVGEHFDLIVLPGGMPGSARLRENDILKKMTVEQAEQERLVGAICAAPAVVLQEWGLLEERKATCHPGFIDSMNPALTTNARVQEDGCIMTSRGPGTAFDFALSFVEKLYGVKKLEEVTKPLVLGSRGRQENSRQEFNTQDWRMLGIIPRALVPIANGSEEMESIIIVDVLRRAGMKVTLASVEDNLSIEASRCVKIIADKCIQDVENLAFDIIVLPGGMPGSERLRDCKALHRMLEKQIEEKRPVAAICAAPVVVLHAHGWLKGKKATCHPSFVKNLPNKTAAKSRVVIDGYTMTSRGPGTTMEFALSIVEKLLGKERALSVAKAMVFEYS